MSLCCLPAASSRCPGFSLRSLDVNPGMILLAKSIQRWLGAINTGLWACPFVLSEFHIREKQNAGKPEFSFCPCSLPHKLQQSRSCQPVHPPVCCYWDCRTVQTVSQLCPRSFLRTAASGATHASVSNPDKLTGFTKLALNRIFSTLSSLSGANRNRLLRKSQAIVFLQEQALKELLSFSFNTLGTKRPTHKLWGTVYEHY